MFRSSLVSFAASIAFIPGALIALAAAGGCSFDVTPRIACVGDAGCLPGRVCQNSVCRPDPSFEPSEAEDESTPRDAGSTPVPSTLSDAATRIDAARPVDLVARMDASPAAPDLTGRDATVMEAGPAPAPQATPSTLEDAAIRDAGDASVDAQPNAPTCSCPRPEVRIPWRFPEPNSGYYNLDQSLEIVSDGPSMSFSHEIRFHNDIAPGAALGITTDAPLAAGKRGKGAYFSMWGATDARGDCKVEDPLEAVTTCRIAYDFLPNHVYTLRIWRLEDVDQLWWYWGAWIADVQAPDAGVMIGQLRSPYGKNLLGVSESVIRYQARTDACSEEPNALVRWAPPRTDGDTLRATAGNELSAGTCSLASVRSEGGKVEVRFNGK